MQFTLNGTRVRVDAHPMTRLLDVLREQCELTGTKEGCGEGECGACTVLIDRRPVNSCLVPLAQVAGAKVTTIEGLGGKHPLQHAFIEFGGAQCGNCRSDPSGRFSARSSSHSHHAVATGGARIQMYRRARYTESSCGSNARARAHAHSIDSVSCKRRRGLRPVRRVFLSTEMRCTALLLALVASQLAIL